MPPSDTIASLLPFNSFQLDSTADRLIMLHSQRDVDELLTIREEPLYIIGGGSNILLTEHISGTVAINRLKGINIVEEVDAYVVVEVASGEVWHEFVLWALEHGYGGVENLSLIPGTVGAAPIQNIGAYGVEVSSVLEEVKAVELESGEVFLFDKGACELGYRNSVFKQELKGKFFITSVRFKLTKKNHSIEASYWAIEQWLSERAITKPSIQDISQAVIQIRKSKLPDPKVLGNAGSFFKNLEVSADVFRQLIARYPDAKYFELPDGRYKIPTGWLIDRCGWKGKRLGRAGCHKDQALVLVNHGHATGQEVLALARRIQEDVFRTFGLKIEPEVNIWP